ncbi:MAG: matrixin family metalloprotease [Paludisphaera borealis]|uniref:matrixin family metalloprotease n=1 Tax=Paludisphaera borealis TaxID=1387353 RepID=UPI002845BD98|nr:matrixin family metalloprotease [Paludisphaera borealis]MDR3621492.1 matrixin family metalloprotease [Paludisphaera borealis]
MAAGDYVLTGYQWSNPGRITYSIAPDGVYWGHGTNTLNAYFNSTIGSNGAWQRQIARALATWQSVANINIVQVADGPYDEDTRGLSQGDPRFGDIRFGGYAYANNQTTLAATAFPPPQGWTIAGDVQINTSLKYKVGGGDYDLYSVMLHETGHSLGLDHSTNPVEVMNGTYQGVRTTLAAGDIAGIQAIYGARQLDVYQSKGYGLSSSVPIDMSPMLVSANTSTASSASLTKIGDVEWFSFVAPSYASGSWQATASASNLSLLSPKITVYDAAGNVLGQAANSTAWGDDVSAAMKSVTAGQRYFIAVTGATGDVFDTGAYQLSVTLSGKPTAPAPPPPTSVPVTPPVTPPVTIPVTPPVTAPVTIPAPVYPSQTNYVAPDRLEPNDTFSTASRLGKVSQGTVYGLNLNTGSDLDYFTFQTSTGGSLQFTAAGTTIVVYNSRGKVLAQGAGVVNVSAARNATLIVRTQSPNSVPVASYTLTIAPKPIAPRQVNSGKAAPKPAPKVVPRVVAKPMARLARQEVVASGFSAHFVTAGGWTGAMKTSSKG